MAFSSVPTGLSALPAPLHSDALPLVGLDCTGEHVQLVSEHSPPAWGTTPSKKNTYMEMQLKSFFLWIVQAVLRDSGRKCSVRATWCGDGQRNEGPRWSRSTPSAFSIRKPPVLHPSLRHSVLIQGSKSDETHSHRGRIRPIYRRTAWPVFRHMHKYDM